MKTTLNYLTAAFVVLLSLVGCKEEQWDSAKWKTENELYFADLLQSKQYEAWELPKGGALLVKWIKKGPAQGTTPKLSDSVRCHYRGWNKSQEVFDQSFGGAEPTSTDKPLACRPNQLIQGFGYTLTQMRVGDQCEVVIPWYLAYGERGAGSIAPYSTLHFKLELVEVVAL